MTNSNVYTIADKNYLMSLVGTPVFIKSFNLPEGYFSMPSGLYFIDAVIFHFDGHVELGVSNYDPNITIEQFDIDKAHISYFNLDDLEINKEQLTDITLINHQAA
jgi:hypothetical protein